MAKGFSVTVVSETDLTAEQVHAELIAEGVMLKRAEGEDVGTYAISGNGVRPENYVIGSVTGEDFTINPLDIKLIPQSGLSKTYGQSAADVEAALATEYSVEILGETDLTAEQIRDELVAEGIVFARTEGEDAGSYTVSISGTEAKNFNITEATSGLFEIKPLEIKLIPKANQVKFYGQSAPKIEAAIAHGFDVETLGSTDLSAEDIHAELVEAGISFVRAEGENIGNYAISLGSSIETGNYIIDSVEQVDFTILPLPVTLSPAEDMSKYFGLSDEDAGIDVSGNWTVTVMADGVDLLGEDATASVKTALTEDGRIALSRELAGSPEGEAIGDYAYMLTLDGAIVEGDALPFEHGNYLVHFEAGSAVYSIKGAVDLAFAQSEDGEGTKPVTSRDGSFAFTLKPRGGEGTLASPVDVTVTLTLPAEKAFYAHEAELSIPALSSISSGQSVTLPLDLSYEDENGNSWLGGLPAGTVISLSATAPTRGLDGTVSMQPVCISGEETLVSTKVEAYDAKLSLSVPDKAADSYAISGEEGELLSAIIRYQGTDEAFVISSDSPLDEIAVVSVGGKTAYVTVPAGGSAALKRDVLIALGLEVAYVPTLSTQLQISFVDKANLGDGSVSALAAFDNGASAKVEMSFTNRSETIDFVLPEPANGAGGIKLTVDGETVNKLLSNSGNTSFSYDYSKWTAEKPTLDTEGAKLNLEYTDRVGNSCTFSTESTKAEAVVPATVWVQPNPVRGTIGPEMGNFLTLVGKATEYEKLIVTVGGRKYEVTASGSGAYENSSEGSWYLRIPMDNATLKKYKSLGMSVEYVDLQGEIGQLYLKYKDQSLPVVVTSPVKAGYESIHGFTEAYSTVYVTAGGKTYNSNDNADMFSMNTMGKQCYYLFTLPEAMDVGDSIKLQYEDLVGNKSAVEELKVPEKFDGRTFAQPLGASLVESLEDEKGNISAEHRFLLPVEIAPLRRAADDINNQTLPEIEVPVLAYTGYQVGTMKISYADGKLSFSCEIDDDCLYEGASYTLRVYKEKPDLKTVLEDTSESLNIDEALELEGFGNVVWVYAEFDVEVSEERIDEGKGFVALRPLDEETEGDLGMPEELYELYKRFQQLAGNK